jgi:phosphatidate cytidylyltransferase
VKPPSARWRDLLPRLGSALALGPLVLLALWAGGLWWAAVLTLAATVAMFEWTDLNRLKPDSSPFIAAIAALPVAQAAYIVLRNPWAPVDLVLIAAAGFVFWRRVLGLGVLYIGAGWVSLLLLRDAQGGFANVLFVVLVVWANDIGAYLAGRLIGGRRMAPSLSPGKTWSGAGGGLVCAIFAGLGVAMWFGASSPGQFRAEGLGAAISILAQGGDLLESGMKRRFGRKDSGGILPGHGGILDRVDGLLAAAPVALVWHLCWQAPFLWA